MSSKYVSSVPEGCDVGIDGFDVGCDDGWPRGYKNVSTVMRVVGLSHL